MGAALDDLVRLLDLEPIEVNIFRGRPSDENRVRVYGGQVAGQALVAAARTVDRGQVHSLHAYFLRPGDPTRPILYQVDRIRDGRSFATRRVVAIQHGEAIFNIQASFHVYEPGPDHQLPPPSDLPDPESLPNLAELRKDDGMAPDMSRPIDVRYVQDPTQRNPDPAAGRQQVWLRADGPLPSNPLLHACVVTYASDMTLLDTTTIPHAFDIHDPTVMMASLDHAMWFHRPFRADDWLLYDQQTPSTFGGRGLAFGSLYTRAGDLAVSVVQEGLLRKVR